VCSACKTEIRQPTRECEGELEQTWYKELRMHSGCGCRIPWRHSIPRRSPTATVAGCNRLNHRVGIAVFATSTNGAEVDRSKPGILLVRRRAPVAQSTTSLANDVLPVRAAWQSPAAYSVRHRVSAKGLSRENRHHTLGPCSRKATVTPLERFRAHGRLEDSSQSDSRHPASRRSSRERPEPARTRPPGRSNTLDGAR
jgi:hypothetical protein